MKKPIFYIDGDGTDSSANSSTHKEQYLPGRLVVNQHPTSVLETRGKKAICLKEKKTVLEGQAQVGVSKNDQEASVEKI